MTYGSAKNGEAPALTRYNTDTGAGYVAHAKENPDMPIQLCLKFSKKIAKNLFEELVSNLKS